MRIVKGDKYEEITKALEKTNNQCPCIPKYAWDDNTECICKEFLEQEELGHCHCRRYKKVKD